MDRLTYIGHATTLIRLGQASILTDPMLRRGLGPLRRQGRPPPPELPMVADVVLISHLHRDHLDLPSLRRIPAETPLVIPRGASRWVATANANRIREIDVGETIVVGDVEVTAVPAVHDGHRYRWGDEIQPVGYRIHGGRRTAYFAGDTELFAGMSDLGPVDLALLPVWGWGASVGSGHLDPDTAAQAVRLIRPRLAVPIHWGTFYPAGLRRVRPEPLVRPPLEFADRVRELAPEVEVRVLQPGNETSLERP
jgi:L-ascorbate metabolism protein UlaG (beta-lactamase superfamily)